MVNLSLQISIGTEIRGDIQEIQFRVKAAMQEAIFEWVEHMIEYINTKTSPSPTSPRARPQGHIPWATGNLIRNIKHIVTGSALQNLEATFQMGTDLDYAIFVDQGRPAGAPPIAPLLAWAQTVGVSRSVAYGIQQRMKDEFTPGYHFLKPLYQEGYRFWRHAIQRSFNRRGIDFTWEGTDVVVT